MATAASVRLALSSTFCTRVTSCARSRTSVVRDCSSSRGARRAAGGMKLARSSPCRSRSASHALSATSVLRPGTCLTCCGLTSTTACPPSSSSANTGHQNTPVRSRTTRSTCRSRSQALSAPRSAVIVPNVRTSRRAVPSGWVTSTHATTVRLCTSNPAHRWWITCIGPPPRRPRRPSLPRPGQGAEDPTRFLRVLAPAGDGDTPRLLDAPSVSFLFGLGAPNSLRPQPTGRARTLRHFHHRLCPPRTPRFL